MAQDILPVEIERSITKLDKADLRKELSKGWGATTGGQAITGRYHERLTEGVTQATLSAHESRSRNARDDKQLVVLLRQLPAGVIALSCLQTVLHSIGLKETLRDTLVRLGSNIADELWAANLTIANDSLHARIAKAARAARTTDARYAFARDIVAEARKGVREGDTEQRAERRLATAKSLISFKERVWTRDAIITAGAWLWNVVSSSLPDVFSRIQVSGSTEWMVSVSEAAWGVFDEAVDRRVNSNPVFWPSAEEPKAWDSYAGCGSHDARVNGVVTVLRSYHKDTQSAVKHAIKSGTMKPALDALNTLQAVPFTINTQVLDVIHACVGSKAQVKGLPPQNLLVAKQPNGFAWEAMTEAQQRFWKTQRAEKIKTNVGFVGDRALLTLDLQVADAMAKHEVFYTPMNLDWRGRVYGLPHFNFQREDRVRALFLFANGAPIGTEGLWWLQAHTANCGDFGKISKRPLEERVAWCRQNGPMITNIASDPLVHTEWMGADKPFLFLAACFELSAAWAQGSSFITQLPVSFDGSCSGLQHLCAMTRAAEGSMVNLTPSPLPQDVYQKVADDTYEAITADLEHAPDPEAKDPEVEAKKSKDIRAMAQLFLAFDGNRRTLCKRNVMTFAYSSRAFGMSAQQQTDLMEPLAREVLEGKREEHPFVGYNLGHLNKKFIAQPSKAARYFAGRVFKAIKTRIHKPAEAMKFLQDITNALSHEGKPVQWTTPAGVPWINRYHEPEMTLVRLYLVDGGVKSPLEVRVATGSKKSIDKDKAANGVAPNFVHALDAAHLLLVANAARAEGILSLATVHDSFGCLASQATRFNAIIREQFALMYSTHDVLTEILEQASCDLTPANRNRLPTRPVDGPLNLKDILDAEFAFA
jgi:DNA-directed RNA polymerase